MELDDGDDGDDDRVVENTIRETTAPGIPFLYDKTNAENKATLRTIIAEPNEEFIQQISLLTDTRYIVKLVFWHRTAEDDEALGGDIVNEIHASEHLQNLPGVIVAKYWRVHTEDGNVVSKGDAEVDVNDLSVAVGILVFERMDMTLDELIHEYPEFLTLDTRVDLCEQLATALNAIHEKGYYHNDLHLGNLLIKIAADERLELYVNDFGFLSSDEENDAQNDANLFQLDCRAILVPTDAVDVITMLYGKDLESVVQSRDRLPSAPVLHSIFTHTRERAVNRTIDQMRNRYDPDAPKRTHPSHPPARFEPEELDTMQRHLYLGVHENYLRLRHKPVPTTTVTVDDGVANL